MGISLAPEETKRYARHLVLKGIGGTGPYFHDGRYKTLRELLVSSDGKMGNTKHLSNDDLDALEAFMRSL